MITDGSGPWRRTATWMIVGLACAGCGDGDGTRAASGVGGAGGVSGSSGTGGSGGGDGGAGGTGAPTGFCGDGDCRLVEGENTHLCEQDCGGVSSGAAVVRFFADFDSKATEYGRKVRFTYVVWNEGTQTARNVVLPMPVVQNAGTTVYGDRHFCDAGGKYDCMVDLSYAPDSMRINRVYHPNRARNSYYFVDTTPLTDSIDGDEAFFDADQNVLYLTLAELRPRSTDPETAGVIWSYELSTDGAIADTPCEQKPRIQNWNWIFADNADEYMNDIIGHILCESPRLHGSVSSTAQTPAPGDTFQLSVTMSYDDAEPPDGISKERFAVARPRLFLNYPEQVIAIESIDAPDEVEELRGKEDPAKGGGVVDWARQDAGGQAVMQPGEQETLTVTARVKPGMPAGTPIELTAKVVSQNTLPYQDVDGTLTLQVGGAVAAACGDGVCTSPSETAANCAQDCPACVGEDDVTSFGDPPCCDGLTMIRASYPYGWAYDQCYDWEGGGVSFAQAFCTACGDGACKGAENACNCPIDCGPHCGNWVCETGETRASCPSDC